MEWINRLGLVFEFLSFWFAAPEILGEKRLRTLERRLERGLRALPRILLILLFSTAMVVVTVMFGLLWGWRMLLVVLAVLLAMAAVFWILLGQTLLFWVVLVWELVMIGGVFWKLIGQKSWSMVTSWLFLALMMAMAGLVLVDLYGFKVVRPLLRTLADDKRIRQRSLAVAAVLFVVGFLLQLIATF